MRSWPVTGVVFAVLWMFIRGTTLAPMALLGQLLLGLAAGLPIAFVFRRLYPRRVDLGAAVGVLPATGGYLLAVLWELVRANADVAARVLAPSLPMDPEVILIPLRVEGDAAITLLANSITLTPGTITLDYAEEVNALYVHVVDGRDPEGIVGPIRRWEDYALVMFDEERSPADPAPEIVESGGDRWDRRTAESSEIHADDGSRDDPDRSGASAGSDGRAGPDGPDANGGDGRDGE